MNRQPANRQPSTSSATGFSTDGVSRSGATQIKTDNQTKALERYLSALKAGGASDMTTRNYRSDVGQFLGWLQAENGESTQSILQAAATTARKKLQLVENFRLLQRKKGLSEATVRRKGVAVNQFLSWLASETVPTTPTHSMPSPSSGKSPVPFQKNSEYLIDIGIEKTLNQYLSTLKYNSASDATIRNYRSDIKQFAYFIRERTLARLVTLDNLKRFAVQQKQKGLKATSIQRKLVSITQFAIWAQRRNLISGISADWPALVLDSIFSAADGPLILATPPAKPEEAVRLGRRPRRQYLWAGLALLLLLLGSSVGLYLVRTVQDLRQQASVSTTQQVATSNSQVDYSQLTTLMEGEHVIPFQGKLYRADSGEQVFGSATASFKLLDGPSEDAAVVWDSGLCQISTDASGVFSLVLGAGNGDGTDGTDCGVPLDNDEYYGNSNLWLSPTIGGEQLALYPIKTVSYSLDSAALSGAPLGDPVVNNSVLYMNPEGEILFADPPTFSAPEGVLSLAGQQINLLTVDGEGIVYSDSTIVAPSAFLGAIEGNETPLLSFANTEGGLMGVVTTEGRLGLGTDDPQGLLGLGPNGAYITTSGDTLQFYDKATNTVYSLSDLARDQIGTGGGGVDTNFWTQNGTAISYAGGQVGVGTSTTEQALTVGGNIQLGVTDGDRYIYFDNGTATNAGIRYNAATDKIQFSHDGSSWSDLGAGGGVTSVTNSDGTLSVSPTTGNVVVSLNLANANTWTALQTFGDITAGGTITFNSLPAGSTNTVLTLNGSNQVEQRTIDGRVWGSSLIDGTGTTGYLAYWSDADTLAADTIASFLTAGDDIDITGTTNATIGLSDDIDLTALRASSASGLSLYDDGSNLALFVEDGGAVGVGTASPEEILTIEGNLQLGTTDATRYIYFDNGTANNSGFRYNSTTDELEYSDDGTTWVAFSGLGAVTSVSNADGTLTISPTTGNVIASLNLNNANTWTGLQTFNSLAVADTDVALTGASTNFTTTGNFSVNTNDLFIEKSTGEVGIGTTTPSQALDVTGAIRLGATGANNVLNTSAGGSPADDPLYWGNEELLTSANLATYGVASVGNSDGTLTISPTTGNVVASLNLNKANTWTATQTFGTAVATTFSDGTASLSGGTLDLGTNTIADGNLNGAWNFNSGNVSGINNLTAGGTITLSGLGAGTTNTVLVQEAGNSIATRSIDSRVWGSSLVDGTGTANYVAYWSDADTLAAEQFLATSRGGLGGNVTAAGAGEILYSTSTTAYDSLAAGSSGQLLTSGGAGAPSWTNIASSLTAGDDIDITGTTNATIALEDDIDLSAVRASSVAGLGLYDDGGNLGVFVADGGNVGIGTNTPDAKLHVNVGSQNQNIKFSAANGFSTGLDLFSGTQYSQIMQETTGELSLKNRNEDENIQFIINDGSVLTTAMTIEGATGEVGIGTSAPEQLLTVNGNIQLGTTDATRYIYFDNGTANNSGFRYNATADQMEFSNDGTTWTAFSDLTSGLVTSVSNVDGTLTISPTTGNVVASLNLANANTWTALQTFGDLTATGDVELSGLGTGTTNTVLVQEADDTIGTRSIDSRVWGSSLVDGSGTTNYVAYWSDSNTLTAEQYLATSRGGLGGNVTAAGAGEVLYSTGTTAYDSLAAGTSGQLLTSGGAGAPSWTNIASSLTAGDDIDITGTTNATIALEDDIDLTSLRASSASGLSIYDDGSNLGVFIEDGGDVGIGTNAPEQDLTVAGSIQLGVTDGTRYIYFDNGTSDNAGFRYNTTADQMEYSDDGTTWVAFDDLTNAVSSVSNADGTLTISPTTGAVVASLNLANANTWTALQTFGDLTATGDVEFSGLGTGTTNTVIVKEADDTLAERTIDSRVWGSSLVDGSGTTNYVAYWSDSNTIAAEQYLATSRGGLGGNVTAAGAGEVLYSTGTTTYDSLAAGTSGQLLTSGGAGAPSWTNIASSLTAGDDIDITGTTNATIALEDDIDLTSLRASSGSGLSIYDDGSNLGLFVEDGGDVGIGTNAPEQDLTVAGSIQLGVTDGTRYIYFDNGTSDNAGFRYNTTSDEMEYSDDGTTWVAFDDLTNAVTSVSNVDGTLTISPTTGAVVASLNLNNANTWTALQTFGDLTATGDVELSGLGTGTTNTVLVQEADDTIGTRAIDSRVWGSSLVDGSGTTNYVAYWSDSNTLTAEQFLATSRGGLGGNVTAAGAGEVLYSTSTTTYDSLAAGTSGQLLTSGGAGAPSWTNIASSLTAGDDIDITGTTNATIALEDDIDLTSLRASSGSGLSIYDDGSNLGLFVEDGGDVGIGTNAPEQDLTVAGSIQLGVTDGTRYIYFDNGTADNAGLRYNTTSDEMEYSDDGTTWVAFGSLANAVTSVSNADGTLTISPTTGNVVASLNLANANTWTALQTFGDLTATGDVELSGLGTGTTNTVLVQEADDTIGTRAIDSRVWGSSLVDGSGTTNYVAYWSDSNTLTAEQYLATSRGGLGGNVTAAGAGEVLYSTSTTAYDSLAAGSSGQLLVSGGAGAPSWSNIASLLTAGDDIDITGTTNATIALEDDIDLTSLRASSASGLSIYDDGSNLGVFIEDGGDVGIGTNAPEQDLTVAGNIQLGVTDATRTIYFDNGTASNSGFRYNSTTDEMEYSDDGTTWVALTDLGGVTSVSNADGTLTISPTTGAVVASLNLANANTWTALQTFGDITATGDVELSGLGTGTTNTVLVQEADDTIGTRAIDSRVWGSSLVDGSGTTNYVAYWSDSNTLTAEQYLATSRGGLGGNVTAAGAGEVLYSTGTTTYDSLAAGTSGQLLTSGGAGAPSWTNIASSLTAGDDIDITGTTNATIALEDDIDLTSLRASSGSGLSIYDDGSNLGLFIEDGGDVGIGTNAPEQDLTVAGSIQLGVTDGTRYIYFDNGTSDNAGFRYNTTSDEMEYSDDGTTWVALTDLGGVTSVSNADGTLTISPTTGAVVASLNLANANTWTALQTFGDITATGDVELSGLGTGTTNTVLVQEADDTIGTRSIDSRVWGSSLVDGSGTTNYVAYWSDSNTLTAEQYLATSRGGLGGNVTAAGAGEVLYSTGTTTYDSLAAGTSGQLLTSGGAGAPSWTNIASSLTAGDDIDITGTTNATIALEDDIDLTSLRASSGSGLSIYDDGSNLGLFVEDGGDVGVGTNDPEQQLTVDGNIQLGVTDATRYIYFDNGTADNAGFRYNATADQMEFSNDGTTWTAFSDLTSGLVTSVSNADGTLTISPTTGAVVASLNLANANTWTGLQTFDNQFTDFAEYLRHAGDTDTFLQFTPDNLIATIGNETLLTLTEDTQDLVKLGDGGDVDINLNDMAFIEGSSGNFGVGTLTPSAQLDVQNTGTAKNNLDIFELTNDANATDMDGTATGILFNQYYYDASTPAVADAARIAAGTETDWTSTASTQDSYLSFQTALDGTLTERLRITSAGVLDIGTNTIADGDFTGDWDFNGGDLSGIGDLTAAGTITLSGLGTGTTNTVLVQEADDTIGTRSIDSRVWGSSLVDGSGTTNYVAYWSDSNTLTAEQYLATSRGGLGGNVTAAGAGEVLYSTGTTAYDSLAAGTSGQLLTSGGAGAPSWTNIASSLTAGDDIDITGTTNATIALEDDIDLTSLRASSGSGLSIYDDGSNLGLFVEDGGDVGIGTNAPEQDLTVAGSIQLGVTDGTRYIYFDNGTSDNAGFRYNTTSDEMEYSDDGTTWVAFDDLTNAVSSVSNADGTLTISPTTGAVVASLNLANANTWTALQTFGDITATGDVELSGLGTGTTNTVLVQEADDTIGTRAIDSRVWGSSLVDGSGTTNYVAYWSDSNTLTAEQYLATSRGGLGGNVTAAGAGEVLYSTSTTAYDSLAAGTSGQLLTSGGAGAPSWTNIASSLTAGDDIDITGTTNATIALEDDIDLTSLRASSGSGLSIYDDGSNLAFFVDDGGNVGIGGVTSPTAYLDLAAATSGQASLNISSSSGTDPSSPNSGDLWWNGTNLYFYNGSTSTDLLAGGGGAVTSVSNADGTLTISPTTGAVVASLNLANANTWTALQTFGDITATGDVELSGLGTGTTNTVLVQEADDTIGTRSIDSRVWGSSLVDGSGTTNYVAYWSDSNTLTAEQYLATSRGGLGGNVTAAGAGEILYSTSTTAYDSLAAGTSGQLLTSGGAGAPSWTNIASSLTAGDDIDITGTTNATIALEDDIDLTSLRASTASGLSIYDDGSNLALFVEDGGNVGVGTGSPEELLTVDGNIQLGTTDATRYIYFDNGTSDNAGFRYNSTDGTMEYSDDGTTWIAFSDLSSGSNFFTNSGSVASGSYIDVSHNQGTYNVVATAFINNGTNWVEIDDLGRIAHNIYDPNLVGWYKAEEASGDLDNAEGTSARDLIDQGAPTYQQTGKINYAVELDGIDDFFCTGSGSTCADDDDFDFGDDSFTIGGWFKHDTIATDPDYLMTKYSPDASVNVGTGADGAISISTDTDINTTNSITGRSCADGGDAVNYSVTALSSTTATLESTPSTGCLSVGDEVLLINLRGAYTAFGNAGNYETFRVANVSSNTVTFTEAKTKYYGDGVSDDTNIGLGDSNQAVMLQRVPNYTSVSISGSGTDFVPSNWVSPVGSADNGAGEGGVMFFRATGAVSVGAGATINATTRGYIGGLGGTTASSDGGGGGEAYCGSGGARQTGNGNGNSGAAGGGAGGTTSSNDGGNGSCGGGGGVLSSVGDVGVGSASAGGAGGGGGARSNAASGGAGGGAGYGTAGGGGEISGSNGDTNQSGDGGDSTSGGGGGGGTYGDTNLNQLFFGAAGGGGGTGTIAGAGGNGGDGGGIIFISANSISVTGNIQSNGESGQSSSNGEGGGGAGGSVKLVADTVTLGSSFVTASAGAAGGGTGANAGAGGVGRIAVEYATSVTGSTSPTYNSTQVSASSGGYKLYMNPAGNYVFGIDDDQSSFPEDSATSATDAYDDNQWHHVVAVKKGTEYIKLYVDGEEVSGDYNLSTLSSISNGNPFYLGVDYDGSSNPWDGSFDEPFVYSRALSPGEIEELYHSNSRFRIEIPDDDTVRLYNDSDGTANLKLNVITDGGTGANYWQQIGSDLNYTTGNVGIGTTTPTSKLHLLEDNAVNNDITNLLTLTHTTSGTASDFTGFSPDTNGALETDLISYWKLDETSGSAIDSRNSNNLTETSGTIAAGTGIIGGARDFEAGDTEYFNISSNSQLLTGDIDYTIQAWINAESTPNPATIVSKYEATDREYILELSAGSPRFNVYSGGGGSSIGQVTSSVSISTGVWYHVVAYHSATNNEVGIIVNGTQNTATTSGAAGASSSAFRIGARGASSPVIDFYFDGLIDEVGFWKKTLSTQEVSDLYNSGVGNTYQVDASGIGSGILFQTEDAGGNIENSSRISSILSNVADGAEAGELIFETRTGGAPLTRTARLDGSGNLTIKGTLTQNGSPDIAENVIVTDHSISAGDVVMIDDSYTPPAGSSVYNTFAAKKANVPYGQQLLGVISTDPGIVLNAPESTVDTGARNAANERPLVLAGRVPVKIDPDSEPFKPGDMLTASEKPGYAKKATQGGQVLGKALQFWPIGGEDSSRSLVFVQPGYWEPEFDFETANSGAVTLQGESLSLIPESPASGESPLYRLTTVSGKVVHEMSAFRAAMIANLQTGVINTQQLIADNITVAGQSLAAYIQGIVDQTIAGLPDGAFGGDQELLSPLPGEDVTIALNSTDEEKSVLQVTNGDDEAVLTIDSRGNLTALGALAGESLEVSGTSRLGELLVTGDATVSGTLQAEVIAADAISAETVVAQEVETERLISASSRLEYLEGKIAEFENVKAITAEVTDATVSGTLYAQTINNFDQMIAAAFQQPSLLTTILNTAPQTEPFDGFDLSASNAQALNVEVANLALDAEDVVISPSAVFINDYLKVNGAGYIGGSLGVGQNLVVGDGIQIGNGALAYRPTDSEANTTFYIQPERTGMLSFLGNLMTLSADGQVVIDGDVRVAGAVDIGGEARVGTSLLTNLLRPLDPNRPFQIQLAEEASQSGQVNNSRFEIIDELGTPVATISASGRANFAGGLGVDTGGIETTEPGVFMTTKTAGRAYFSPGLTEVTIKSDKITADTLIYVTPLGSTNNQVIYVKSQVPEDPSTLVREGQFVVALDFPLTTTTEFNWWMVQ